MGSCQCGRLPVEPNDLCSVSFPGGNQYQLAYSTDETKEDKRTLGSGSEEAVELVFEPVSLTTKSLPLQRPDLPGRIWRAAPSKLSSGLEPSSGPLLLVLSAGLRVPLEDSGPDHTI